MISLTREVRLSVEPGADTSVPEFANTWAGWPQSLTLAPYLCLRITLVGEPDPITGYLCDIKILDSLLREGGVTVANQLAAVTAPTPERFLRTLWKRLGDRRPGGVTITELHLYLSPYLSFAIRRASLAMIYQTEQFEFSAAHRLHCPRLSDAENLATFGKCNNLRGHGHNYVIEVVVAGRPDTVTGLLVPRHHVAEVVKRRVLDRFDHKHLNEDTEEFRTLNPTVENIARVIFDLLVHELTPARLTSVRVYETPKTWAECRE
jgi:6-pyruvoyltetrahydropterin/6-carboxytetrahydropterin synthase